VDSRELVYFSMTKVCLSTLILLSWLRDTSMEGSSNYLSPS